MKDSKEKLEDELKYFVVKQTRESFNAGAMAIIYTLEEAMKVSGLDYVPAKWLDTAKKEMRKKK